MASPDLCNHWGREGWCSDQCNGAAEARVIFSRNDVDLGRAAKLGQGAPAQCAAHDQAVKDFLVLSRVR